MVKKKSIVVKMRENYLKIDYHRSHIFLPWALCVWQWEVMSLNCSNFSCYILIVFVFFFTIVSLLEKLVKLISLQGLYACIYEQATCVDEVWNMHFQFPQLRWSSCCLNCSTITVKHVGIRESNKVFKVYWVTGDVDKN